MDIFDPSSWDWGAILKGVLTVGSTIAGANQTSNANTNAANIAASTAATNAALFKEAGDKGRAAVQPVLDQGNAIAQPGINYLKTVTAQNPYVLTPQQSREVADRTLSATRGVPLSLRGSGRSSTAIINDTVNRAKDAMITQNLARGDASANTLTSQGLSSVRTAAPALANIATGQASNIAAENTSAGSAAANAGTANAASNNDAISAISSYFAGAIKDATRGSAYDKYEGANS